MKDLKNTILEALSNTWLFEMVYSRQDYLYRIMGLTKQIVENWCLIKYCNLYDIENCNRLHWSKELIAHLENLCDCNLKKGLNKLKTTEYALIYKAELDDKDVVYKLLYRKWKDENLPDYTKSVVAKAFSKEVLKICKLIANNSIEDIEKYVYEEIDDLL